MSELSYKVRLDTGFSIDGKLSFCEGINSVAMDLPEGHFVSVSAEMDFPLNDAMIFMNGYQTWTSCPELTKSGKIRGLKGTPKFIIDKFGLDRYGDYHFCEYPNKKGLSHGFSYMYLRNGDTYRLIGSVSERIGYTIFSYDANTGKLAIRRDCQGVRSSGNFHAFDLFYAEGTEQEVFDGWFDAMGIKPRTTERLAGYSSWYNRYQDISEKSIMQDLRGCTGVLEDGDLFQIDDGWEPFVGDWLETDSTKFPNGLVPAVQAIHDRGFKAGLWLAPFVAQKGSKLMAEHPDWLLSDENGEPWCLGSNWGGFYALDLDKPEVIDYVKICFRRVFDEWGFDLVKLDFLYGGAPVNTESESRAAKMFRGMELLRECCGDKLILGCGVPVVPAFGLVDYCRVSCDVGLDWNDVPYMRIIHRERVSTRNAIWNDIFRRQLNWRAHGNDPDVFFLRDENLKLTEDEKLKLAKVCALFSGIMLTSDDMSKYDDKKKDLYRTIRRIRDAKDVKVENDGRHITVSYMLDGEKDSFVI